ncbi:MAG: cupredoxin family protein [Herminiimonas sp.]|nr:cupredoxin family protein [Herminiimonas sp.]
MKRLHQTLFLALMAACSAGTAIASGTHTGGHANDAIGKAGDSKDVVRTINVDMTDTMRFSPSSFTAKQGETVRFVVTNSGKLKHEMVLGTRKELKEHSELMKKNPEMEHDDPNQITIAPGGKGEIVWQFTQAGKVDFACLQPGHYDAGMKGDVKVSASKGTDGHKSRAH